MTRNFREEDRTEEFYENKIIIACKYIFEEYDNVKNTWEKAKKISCVINNDRDEFWINLGECNNGDKFTSIGQAINQAKNFIWFTKKQVI